MARLKCKHCEQFFELNGTFVINCPHCGIKLENSFTEWKQQKGNKRKTFDDYKKKKCYPSAPSSQSATKYQQKENKASRSHNPYKEILKKRESHKAFLKKVYIISAISAIILLALITNPNVDAHKKAFHEN